jgi:hypothetical protein
VKKNMTLDECTVGRRVRLTQYAKRYFNLQGGENHVEWFGDCVGGVERVDESFSLVIVRWEPSGSECLYVPGYLEPADTPLIPSRKVVGYEGQ